ncbi:MAG: TIGR01244 family phosphatase [Salaquimonas sp.]|jgi:sulfide:quinone oxidoreductase|nr:TIGR01244 family phosphatase [Salaquimonas sp.]
MATLIQLEENVFVAPQLVEADFAEIAALGFRSVVGNRPDGEAEDQMPQETARAAAERHGLEFRYDPVRNFDITEDAPVEAFADALEELPGPILFYCRTGTRCTLLWAQASVERLGLAKTTRIAAEAGYDLAPIRDALEERLGLVAA